MKIKLPKFFKKNPKLPRPAKPPKPPKTKKQHKLPKVNIKTLLLKLKNVLLSPLPVAGLEVSSTALKFLLIKENKIIQASLRLPPNVIHRGEINDKKLFISALKKLHLQVAPLSKPLTVILTSSPNLTYTQTFSVPIVNRDQLEESIRLNLQMISPNKIEDSYYDWQVISENKSLGQVDLLGAFIDSKIVDEYREVLKEAGFQAVAVEFTGLALARLIRERWGGLSNYENYLLISINSEGILLLILKNGSLYFSHFNNWTEIIEKYDPKSLQFEQIKDFLTQEIQRVLNFYLGRFGKPLKECILVSTVFNQEIFQIASKNFSLKVRNLVISELPKLQSSWFAVLGSALRGIISRSKDTAISLTKTDAQKGYYQERWISFIGMWRNFILIPLVFVLIAFVGVEMIFIKEDARLREKIASEFSLEDIEKNVVMQERINQFNGLLDLVEQSVQDEVAWSSFLEKMESLSGETVSLDRLLAAEDNQSVVISARANTEDDAIAFKNRLTEDENFTDVSLPLSNIKNEPNGSVTFSLTFKSGLEEEE